MCYSVVTAVPTTSHTMSVKVTFQLELSEMELRSLLDNRMGNKNKSEVNVPANMPELECKTREEGQRTAKKIREMAPAVPKVESDKKSPRVDAHKTTPAYVTRIEDLNDFLRSQLDSGLQMVDLDSASSWLH